MFLAELLEGPFCKKPPTYEDTVDGHFSTFAILDPGVKSFYELGLFSKNLLALLTFTDCFPGLFSSFLGGTSSTTSSTKIS